MNKSVELSPGDRLSIELLMAEGLFFNRVLDHDKKYPDSAKTLALLVAPYISVIDHESISYLNRTFHFRIKHTDKRVSQIRHRTKILCTGRLSYEDYSNQAAVILQKLRDGSKLHRGVWATLLNRSTNDIGVFYYQDAPVAANYSVAHLLAADGTGVIDGDREGYSRSIGYELGDAGRVLYRLARERVADSMAFSAPEFIVGANDFVFDKIATPIKNAALKMVFSYSSCLS